MILSFFSGVFAPWPPSAVVVGTVSSVGSASVTSDVTSAGSTTRRRHHTARGADHLGGAGALAT
ncbi:MAG: hypothetical protein KGJ47_09000 [Acidobacteriota bacterium]|nr:hypothetical protein [Acidobacteriota bacterium]